MKILSAEQVRQWDEYTMQHEPISSTDLMERAASACVGWLEKNGWMDQPFIIFCGKGNNGGDGLAIARLLAGLNCDVKVYILEFGHKGSPDFQENLARLQQAAGNIIHFIHSPSQFPALGSNEIVIDALLGTGLNRAIEGLTAELVSYIASSGNDIISIDIPSGLFADKTSLKNPVIPATHTLAFQCYKPAFLFPENNHLVGQLTILDIGLHPGWMPEVEPAYHWVGLASARTFYKPRNQFAHKGNFGHAALLAGSYGKTGAAVLAARACLRSGAGLLTAIIPATGMNIIQTAIPEAMAVATGEQLIDGDKIENLEKFDVMGAGPGLGTADQTAAFLKTMLQDFRRPMVLDADALNIMAADPSMLKLIPPGSVLTPHPKEFERLFGKTTDDFARADLAATRAEELKSVIVLKGHHSLVVGSVPGQKQRRYFNASGNAGMATAGTGDVLTGIITGLMAQQYPAMEAAILGVYLHGRAGDLAAAVISQESLMAGDLCSWLGNAFLELNIL